MALTLAGQGFPVPFAGEARLQVALHIARGQGTSCEVNGEAVCARDVRALFADLAGGARSSAMVARARWPPSSPPARRSGACCWR